MTEKECILKQANEYEVVYSKKHKRKMNRINRETIGSTKAIYPEVDNAFERLRSKISRKIKYNMQK